MCTSAPIRRRSVAARRLTEPAGGQGDWPREHWQCGQRALKPKRTAQLSLQCRDRDIAKVGQPRHGAQPGTVHTGTGRTWLRDWPYCGMSFLDPAGAAFAPGYLARVAGVIASQVVLALRSHG